MRHRRSPRSAPASRSSLLPAIVLLFVSSGVDVAWGCIRGGVVRPTEANTWRRRLESQLQALHSGTREERLEAAARSSGLFERDSDEAPDPSDPQPEEIAWELLNAIAMQPDDFVGWSVLDGFVGGGQPGISLLLRDALQASSPNVRAKAVHWFIFEKDAEAAPALESLWHSGVPEWARADLMAALANQGSTRHVEDFVGLTADDDPAVVLAAIEALDELDDIRGLPRLIELARAGSPYLSSSAMDALSSWPESDEAFQFVLASSFEKGPAMGRSVRSLGKFHRKAGDERLLEVLRGTDETASADSLRLVAARGLEESDIPGVTDAILEFMAEADGEEREWVRGESLRILHNRDDPAALPGLLALASTIEARLRGPYEKLVDYLDRPDRIETHTITVSIGCSFGPPTPDDPDTWHVVAPAGLRTIRCYEGPAVAGTSWLEKRLPDGALVTLSDRFDRDGETWGALDWWSSYCWVPMRLLERGSAADAHPPDLLNPELDLPADAMTSKTARRLLQSGIVEILDEEAEAVGVVFHLELGGPPLVSLLEEIRDDARRAVSEEMDEVVDQFDGPNAEDLTVEDSANEEGGDVALDEPEDEEED